VAGVEQFTRVFHDAFDDLRVEVQDARVEGNRVGTRFTLDLRHTGEFLGIPATGKEAMMTGMAFTAFDADGKIARDWVELDRVGLFQQLGIIPVDEPK
jgi:predicted ester cyclase